MKKSINILMSILICISFFSPFTFTHAKASSTYSVVMVSGTSGNKTVGTYSTYNEAKNAMNAQNSTSTNVATIYKDGKIINAKYAIFKLNGKNETVNLYQELSDTAAYTYTNPAYMLDTAFIDYDEGKNKAKIMLNGFKGWIDASYGTIVPISLYSANMIEMTVSGLNFRSSASTSASSLGSITCTNCRFAYTSKVTDSKRTWYQITYNNKTGWIAGDWASEVTGSNLNTYFYRYSTGNLLHRYAYNLGTTESDTFTNLGPTPSYLSEGIHYYSFDGGIYLYTSLTNMLDDYRNNTYKNALNKDNPNYPYYLYAPARTVSKASASELDKQITNTNSKMYGTGKYFKEAEEKYGVNALNMFSVAKTESSSGTSKIANEKNNLFGYGASDSCPYTCAYTYSSVKDSIMDYAKKSLSSYATAQASYYFGSHQGNKGSGRNVKYASDPLTGEKAAGNAFISDKNNNSMRDYKSNTIAVSKFGKSNIKVYKEANDNAVIYTMRNSNSAFEVYNVPVNVIDKIGDYYKIYTDSTTYQYGYVKVSDFNISNTQPTINASDKTINLNSTFNYMDGVSAYDNEDGNLTGKVSYTGSVDTSKAGSYNVTYTVKDNSNFSSSKTVTITVKGEDVPIINASDKEVSAYTTFNYMDGVSASVGDVNLTDKVTYTESVNTNETGKYDVTYTLIYNGKTVSKKITVTVVPNEKPVINAVNKTVYLNSDFDAKKDVTAVDKEDGDITDRLVVEKDDVNTSVIGDYDVEYSVIDNAGQKTTKKITVTVSEKALKEADGLFYLDYLKNVNGNLQIKGYNTINGIDNNLSADIKYKVIFENIDTGQTYEQTADRITDKNEMTKSIYSLDGKDYTYSWFKINIDLSKLKQGNYKMYIVSQNEDYYSKNIINNKLNKQLDGSYKNDSKSVVIRRNYSYLSSPIELIVRDKVLAEKNAGNYYNQFDKYTAFEFTNNKLHLRGLSYSYGSNLSSKSNVSRKIIFENTETYETYVKDLGSITNGNYVPVLPESDGLDKTRAWYDNNIDISDIPKGKYVIYITTTSNITDIYEFTEKLGRKLDSVRANIDGKEYSFSINYNRCNRIEMTVK